MILLVLSLLALPLGPALLILFARTQTAFIALDAFVVVAITGLVMLHIVPESVACAGWPALVAMMVGLGLPALLHGAQDTCQDTRAPRLFLTLAVGALGLHALLDGVALVPRSEAVAANLDEPSWAAPLAVGVVLHRLMEGAGVWWLTGRQTPLRLRVLALGAMGVMTTAGYFGGTWALQEGAMEAIACVQTMVAGSLLHVLMRHGPEGDHAHGHSHDVTLHGHARAPLKERMASSLGGAGGLLLLWALHVAEGAHHTHGGHGHLHHHGAAVLDGYGTLQALGVSIGPAVLWALLAAAVMHMVAPKWHSPAHGANPFWAAVRGTVQGLLLAPCSCGVVPLYRRLLQKKAPDAQALAYLLAAPGLGLVTLAVSWAVLGPVFTLARAAGAIALSCGVAWLLPVMHAREPQAPHHAHASMGHRAKSAGGRPRSTAYAIFARGMDGIAFASGEVADFTGPWLLFGLLLATLCAEGLNPAWLKALGDAHLTVVVMALLALPLYLCGSASTLIVAVLLAQGLSFGGALAFVWSASMLSPAALSAIAERYGSRRVWAVGLRVSLGVVAAGVLVERTCGDIDGMRTLTQKLTEMEAPQMTSAACALYLLFGWAIARQGVRQAVDQIALLNRDGSLSHHHGGH